MRVRTPIQATVALIALAASMTAHAQPDVDASATTKAPVTSLLKDDGALAGWISKHHADVLAADAKVEQANAHVGTAGLIPNPILDATIGHIAVGTRNPPDLAVSDTPYYDFGLSETIELGKRGPRVHAAELRVEEAKKSREATLSDRMADARLALARTVYAKARLAILEDSLASASKALDNEKVRRDNGYLSGVDYDRLILDNLSLETDVARARADYIAALAACQGTLFATCDLGGAKIDDIDASATIPSTLMAAAQKIPQRADIAAAKLEGAASTEDAVLARRRAIPDPTLRVGYTRDTLTVAGNQPNTLSFTLTIPLPIFDHGQHDAAKAEAKAKEMEHSAASLTLQAQTGLDGLLNRKTMLEATMAQLASTAIPKSAGILDTTSQAFDRGQMSATDLLLARRTNIALLLNQTDVRFEYFNVRNDIRRALGLDEQVAAR